MCGILGVVDKEGAENFAQKILRSQQFRGPDFSKLMTHSLGAYQIILGHNRLAILDLDNRSNQPMTDPSGQFTIVFNGEIYNYKEIREELQNQYACKFITTSDTEVLLKAYIVWGLEVFDKLNGAFALAIFDQGAERIVLARDRFGKKPLYYYFANEQLYFASSALAIANELKLKPNYDYLVNGINYLVYEESTEITQFQNLAQIMPGHFYVVQIKDENLSLKKQVYYHFDEHVQALKVQLHDKTQAALFEYTEAMLKEAVSLRLRADVPIGISLSGGLDSSFIAALAAQQVPKGTLKAFTFGSPNNNKSEYQYAERVAKMHQLDLIAVAPSLDEVLNDFDDILYKQAAPFPGTSIIAQYYIYKTARAHGIKVMLGGQGGDEGFLGYRKFMFYYLKDLKRAHQWRDFILQGASMGYSALFELPHLSSYLNRWQDYRGKKREFLFAHEYENKFFLNRNNLAQAQLLDITDLSLPTLLRYEDRNSMGNSVESRLPFMDYRVLALGAALPVDLKIRYGYGKYILRCLAKSVVPKEISWARFKRGFDNSLYQNWIKQGLGDFLRAKLSQDLLRFLLRKNDVSLKEYFSNEALVKEPRRLAECITLIWLQSIQ